jgi:hypothetical protein
VRRRAVWVAREPKPAVRAPRRQVELHAAIKSRAAPVPGKAGVRPARLMAMDAESAAEPCVRERARCHRGKCEHKDERDERDRSAQGIVPFVC